MSNPPSTVPMDPGSSNKPASGVEKTKTKNVKKYRCCYCDRAFSRSEHRSRHERSHTKERPFHCPKCPSTFVRRDLLLRHDRTVHAIRNGTSGNPKQRKGSTMAEKKNLSTLASAASDSKNESVDVDFNAAVLMTELHNSFHKKPKALPSPPSQEYLPPLSYNPLDLKPSAVPPSSSPSMGGMHSGSPHFAPYHRESNGNAAAMQPNQSLTGNNSAPSTSYWGGPPPPPVAGNSSGPQGLSTNAPANGGPNSFHAHQPLPIQTPQFDPSCSISSLLKYFNETESVKQPMVSPPTRVQLNRYLATYFTYFHPYLPFLHPQTFDPATVAPSLLFAVCSIGALICHENNMASALHTSSKMLVSSIYEVNKDFPNAKPAPIWATQSLILALVCSSWSGDPRGLEFISTIRTSLANMASGAIFEANNADKDTTWKKWLNEESIKRTYFAVFIVFGSLTAVFNYPSALGPNDIPQKTVLPGSELLWNSSFNSENDWYYYYSREPPSPTFSQALDWLLNSNSSERSSGHNQQHPTPPPPFNLTPFAVKVLSTALFIEVSSQQRTPTSNDKMMAALRMWELSLRDVQPGQGQQLSQIALASSFVTLSNPMEENMNMLEGMSPLLTKIRTQQHPMIISGYIMSLVTMSRLAVDLSAVHETIRYHVPHDICSASVNAYAMLSSTGQLRGAQLNAIVSRCFDLIQVACFLGLRLTKVLFSSPLITASIESLLCGFELSLVLVMWIHRVEQDMYSNEPLEEEEALLYSVIESKCIDCGLEKMHGRLAPAISVFVADLLESVESWGLTNVLSLSLRSIAYNLLPSSQTQTRTTQSPPPPPNRTSPYHHPLPPHHLPNALQPPTTAPQLSNLRSERSTDVFSLPFKPL